MFFGNMSNPGRHPAIRLPIFQAAREWLAPDCALCGARCERDVICADCEAALPWLRGACDMCAAPLIHGVTCGDCLRRRPPIDASIAVFEYRYPLDRLVLRFKSSGDFALGRWLSRHLAERVRSAPRADCIVAVPLAHARLRERGFNQSMEIARRIARRLRVPLIAAGVEKVRATHAQQGLSRRERRANLRGAFRCTRSFADLHVALVDDVVTTGATAEAVARELRRAGAARICVWALARTPR
jgi:ComF family protein